MLMKIFILFYILMCIMGVKRVFCSKDYNSNLKNSILKSFETSTPEKSLVSYFWSAIFTSTIYIIAYINIGKINVVMSWLSAIQIMTSIYSSYGVVRLVCDLKDGLKERYLSLLLLYFGSVFDVVYIGLAIYFMYLV